MPEVIAALNKPRRIHDLITFARAIAASLADDPAYAPVNPPLPVFQAHIAAVEEADLVVARGQRGAAEERDAKLLVLLCDLDALRASIQALADANPDLGPALIERAGLHLKASSGHWKGLFKINPGDVSGSVHLYARAIRGRASYEWQHGTDGVRWSPPETTLRADIVLRGLTPGVRYFFRWRRVTRAGKGNWSEPASVLVA